MIVGSGLVVLDIIFNNGDARPIFRAGGTCGNVLAGLSYLGWSSVCIARCGGDIAGELLIRDLVRNGVDINKVSREKELLTPRIVEKLSSDGQSAKHNFLLRCPACATYLPRFQSPRLDQITEIPTSGIRPDTFFFDRATPSTLKLARYFRSKGTLVFFEPGSAKSLDGKAKEAMGICHVVKIAGPEAPPEFSFTKYYAGTEETKWNTDGLVIKTLGKYGLLFGRGMDGGWHYQSSYKPVELHDCCGAGDWCSVGFLYRLKQLASQHGVTIVESIDHVDLVRSALEFAQVLSSLSCSFVGARGLSDALTRDELLDAVNYGLMENEAPNLSFIEKIHRTGCSKTNSIGQKLGGRLCLTCLLPRRSDRNEHQ
jgi:fructokinase